MRLISWNLNRWNGAAVADIAALAKVYSPDLLLMQEAKKEIDALPFAIGGHYSRTPFPKQRHGLAVWSARPLSTPESLTLPSAAGNETDRRLAQIIRRGDITIVNVHLSHSQILLRSQLSRIANAIDGPCAVIGDFNAIGPIFLPRFSDVGPRVATHMAKGILPVRPDRCVLRDLAYVGAAALPTGPSDHHPIMIDLAGEQARVREVRPDRLRQLLAIVAKCRAGRQSVRNCDGLK